MARLECLWGDITRVAADAIVNAANSGLAGGGGVDGAIHRAAGPSLLEECRQIVAAQGPCPPGGAVMTSGGRLAARNVIHTVGPVWMGGGNREAETLSSCYRRSLALADGAGLRSVAFPNISTGVYGYPKALAASLAVEAVRASLATGSHSVEEVLFVCFDRENFDLYRGLLGERS